MVHAGQLLLDVLGRIRNLLLDPRNIQKDTAVRATAAFLDFAHDTAGDMVAGQQIGWTARIAITLRVTPTLLLVVSRFLAICLRNIVEHKTPPPIVQQTS